MAAPTSRRPRRCRLSAHTRPAAQRTRVPASAVCWHLRLERDYYYHAGKNRGLPGPMRTGTGGGLHSRFGRLICWRGLDERATKKGGTTLAETGAIQVSAGKIQRVCNGSVRNAQSAGAQAQPGNCARPLCMSAPMAPVCPCDPGVLDGGKGNRRHGQNPPGFFSAASSPASDGRNRPSGAGL